MDNRQSDDEYLAEIRRRYEVGESAAQIGKATGVHGGTVLYHLKRMGIARPQKRIDWPIEQMRHWYEVDGLTLQQIADRLGQNQKVVNKVAKKNGFQLRRTGPKSGSEHPGWKGGRTTDKGGYTLVYMPDHPRSNSNGYIREHRLVMEQVLGRPLLPTEVVRHIDDNPSNNSPDNLRLYQSNTEHLAETLKGKCPEWTPEGRERIRQGIERHAENAKLRRQKASDGQGLT